MWKSGAIKFITCLLCHVMFSFVEANSVYRRIPPLANARGSVDGVELVEVVGDWGGFGYSEGG
jgi:hypothetical protein